MTAWTPPLHREIELLRSTDLSLPLDRKYAIERLKVSEGTNIEGFHVADCVNFMASMPCGCVDLVVTSPPYDNLKINIWKYERMLSWIL
jgi:hypothetical protein